MFIFMFIQSFVLVFIEYTYFYKLADRYFSKAFTLQMMFIKMLILMPVWTIAPLIQQIFSPQIIYLQIAPKTCKIHHYIH